jgi:hypothetical protein
MEKQTENLKGPCLMHRDSEPLSPKRDFRSSSSELGVTFCGVIVLHTWGYSESLPCPAFQIETKPIKPLSFLIPGVFVPITIIIEKETPKGLSLFTSGRLVHDFSHSLLSYS